MKKRKFLDLKIFEILILVSLSIIEYYLLNHSLYIYANFIVPSVFLVFSVMYVWFTDNRNKLLIYILFMLVYCFENFFLGLDNNDDAVLVLMGTMSSLVILTDFFD